MRSRRDAVRVATSPEGQGSESVAARELELLAVDPQCTDDEVASTEATARAVFPPHRNGLRTPSSKEPIGAGDLTAREDIGAWPTIHQRHLCAVRLGQVR